ncbi:MAG: hypothetical protein DME71_13840 [Verrucomicrobia bacterium]|nr:MAG: hypothetical protein DME71_13840 [Verrucomicrobiota bacterium]
MSVRFPGFCCPHVRRVPEPVTASAESARSKDSGKTFSRRCDQGYSLNWTASYGYESQLENSEVLITLENGWAGVIVSGFANKPGKILFDRPTTVFQAIMEAGGVSDYGSLSNIHLTRIINGVQRTERINLRPSIRGKPIQPKYVQDGDVIYIARSLF